MNLGRAMHHTLDKWVEMNRVYNQHRMEMERRNAETMADMAKSFRSFSQALLNFSVAPTEQ